MTNYIEKNSSAVGHLQKSSDNKRTLCEGWSLVQKMIFKGHEINSRISQAFQPSAVHQMGRRYRFLGLISDTRQGSIIDTVFYLTNQRVKFNK